MATSMIIGRGEVEVTRLTRMFYIWPWHLVTGFFRLAYGFRVEGAERIPAAGPFIVATNEHSVISTLMTAWVSIIMLDGNVGGRAGNVMSYSQEDVLAFRFIRRLMETRAPGRHAALQPHSAGPLALNLLDGLETLRNGGVILLNPDGDMPWDGRPLPIRHALPWLALHSGAPIVPVLCSVGGYDIWPRWRASPYLNGDFKIQVATPFKLCDTAQRQVSERDLELGVQRVTEELIRLRFGPGGVAEWAGPALRNGEPVQVQLASTHLKHSDRSNAKTPATPLWRRGLSMLLWRCPVCRTEDALVHRRPLLRRETLFCQACKTTWALRRIVGHDFRLRVTSGPPDLLGLDMPLSAWYDEMKKGFQLTAASGFGLSLHPGEEAYVHAEGVSLAPHRPNTLFDGWDEREAPRRQPGPQQAIADWATLGQGELWLTNRRMVWRGSRGDLEFRWEAVNSVALYLINTLAIRYGTANYRFTLGPENGLKWLTYAGTAAQRAAASYGHKVSVTPF